MSQEADKTGQAVNDSTPTNAPGPTPADADLSPDPDDRGATAGTKDEPRAQPRKRTGDDARTRQPSADTDEG